MFFVSRPPVMASPRKRFAFPSAKPSSLSATPGFARGPDLQRPRSLRDEPRDSPKHGWLRFARHDGWAAMVGLSPGEAALLSED
jgi:hypothetical protein